jgi:hypothetical protein
LKDSWNNESVDEIPFEYDKTPHIYAYSIFKSCFIYIYIHVYIWLKFYPVTMPDIKEVALAWGSIFLNNNTFRQAHKNKGKLKRKILVQG